jgi:hypothetical protein
MYQPNQQEIDIALLAAGKHGLSSGTPPAPAPVEAPAEPVPEPVNPLAAELETAHKALAASQKTNKSIRINQSLTDAAAAEGIIDPSLAATLLARYIHITDNGTFQVRSEENVPRLNPDMSPLTLQQFVKQFAEQRPYLVASTLRSGAGSTPNSRTYVAEPPIQDFFGSKSSSVSAAKLKRENPNLYHSMKQKAREAGLIDT